VQWLSWRTPSQVSVRTARESDTALPTRDRARSSHLPSQHIKTGDHRQLVRRELIRADRLASRATGLLGVRPAKLPPLVPAGGARATIPTPPDNRLQAVSPPTGNLLSHLVSLCYDRKPRRGWRRRCGSARGPCTWADPTAAAGDVCRIAVCEPPTSRARQRWQAAISICLSRRGPMRRGPVTAVRSRRPLRAPFGAFETISLPTPRGGQRRPGERTHRRCRWAGAAVGRRPCQRALGSRGGKCVSAAGAHGLTEVPEVANRNASSKTLARTRQG